MCKHVCVCVLMLPSCLAMDARAAWNHPIFFEWGKLLMPVISNRRATSMEMVRRRVNGGWESNRISVIKMNYK